MAYSPEPLFGVGSGQIQDQTDDCLTPLQRALLLYGGMARERVQSGTAMEREGGIPLSGIVDWVLPWQLRQRLMRPEPPLALFVLFFAAFWWSRCESYGRGQMSRNCSVWRRI